MSPLAILDLHLVRRVGRNGRGCRGLPGGIESVLGFDAGHAHRLLVSGRPDQDLHLIQIIAAQTGMLQPHLVQGAGRGADVLANTGMRLECAQFTVHVAGMRVPLELDLVRMPLRGPILGSGDLGGIPCESVRIERRREGDPLNFMGWVVDHPVLAADAPPVIILLVIAILAQDVDSRIFEVAVDQMVRQAGVGIRDGLDGSAGLGLGGLGGVLLAALVRRDLA